jgi:hypothetical protein
MLWISLKISNLTLLSSNQIKTRQNKLRIVRVIRNKICPPHHHPIKWNKPKYYVPPLCVPCYSFGAKCGQDSSFVAAVCRLATNCPWVRNRPGFKYTPCRHRWRRHTTVVPSASFKLLEPIGSVSSHYVNLDQVAKRLSAIKLATKVTIWEVTSICDC